MKDEGKYKFQLYKSNDLARLGWFCPVASEIVIFCKNGVVGMRDKCNMKFMFTGENCIAIVRTNMYNEEKDMHEKGALPLCQSQQIYM
ncbi:hypothetical protein [Mediterraneibacter glycyrrhizinilyticus]|uniref:hypothetical protein n=1 Tax=Mediterraneibacter glycyrrhizinilyticus TaxID=342942 RepID=UPI001F90353F|nr:hypothetical protein [Mediterraneibacter glycyrrhizinilyticus]MDM8125836.1 hypothetical protein [Mediterraneibacter glycyrrhizinilyticus]MDM8210081.1 hypothetical protein [Mediterraneibacter glycyrrhizinilyticus]HIY31381.1 hypothetical protein [Candidatus Mediterraneibacter avicola]